MATPVTDLTRPLGGIIGGALNQNVFTNAQETPPSGINFPQGQFNRPINVAEGETAGVTDTMNFMQGPQFNNPINIAEGVAEPTEAPISGDEAAPPGGETVAPTSEAVSGLLPPPAAPTQTGPTIPSVGESGAYDVATMTDRVVGIEPETIEASSYEVAEMAPTEQVEATGYEAVGYEPTLAPEAEGYEATGYEAEGYEALQGVARTTAENVSEAIQRITGTDSPIMQRAVAQATAEANRRGLLNSSMAAGAAQGAILDRAMQIAQGDVQNAQFNVAQQNAMESQNVQMANDALRFTADARNQASAFLANAKNRAAEFLAAERNQNGRFNAEQSNRAAEFSANAQNQASQFLAAAQNQASIFNAGEANRMSMFAAEQANTASRFAAEMQQAANQFNATAFNQAEQRYADAMNAALAAEVDATNLSRRDLANYEFQASIAAKAREATLNASINRLSMGSGRSADAEAQRAFAAAQAEIDRQFRREENEASRNFSREQAGASVYNNMISTIAAAMQNTNLTQEGLNNVINTVVNLANGHPNASVNVNVGGG